MAYGDPENIAGAEQAVLAFRRMYRARIVLSGKPQSKWIDNSELIFDEDGERHGLAPPPRSWKFSFRVIDGFHYDVTHGRNEKFSLIDVGGKICSAKKRQHLNVDPHGFVRGA